MFLGTFAIVAGIWAVVTGSRSVPVLWVAVIALIVSGAASYKLLDTQRAALANNVQSRAERATAKFEEMKAKEDTD